MSRKIDNFIKRSNQSYIDRHGLRQIITCLSLIVILAVFWSLKLTGIGIAGEAFCGMDEHVHDERCQTGELICTLDEQTPHVHTEACLQQTLQCPLEESEGHTHDDSCMDRALICTEEEREGHVHDETCSASTLICVEEAEDHTHSEDCYEIAQVCNLEEDPGHIHGDECYELSPLCGLEEVPGHTHDETCFGYAGGFGCGMTEAEGHTHNAQCVTESTVFVCGEEAREGHAHGVECYDSQETCPLDEHIHVESCYSDITADIETGETWAAAIGELPLGVATRENIVMVARSQLGYMESALNFQVDLQGIRRGITRYGQWYGNPYGDWSAMFVSFCLHYAGADGLPANAGPEAMRLEWEEAGIYRSVDAYMPESGNVIFLDKDGDGRADHAAIISGVTDEGISLIAGDLGRTVTETFIALEDPTILGYGIVMDRNGPVFSTMASGNAISIATTASYNTNLFNDTSRCFVIYTASGGNYYAIDGSGKAVQITIQSGQVMTDLDDPNQILWTVVSNSWNHRVQNLATGRYLYANSGNNGVTTSNAGNVTLSAYSNGAKINGDNGYYFGLTGDGSSFQAVQDWNQGAVFQFAFSQRYAVWLDGTDGGLGHLTGSPDTCYLVPSGTQMTLPTAWQSPSKYSYKLRGWYDVVNARYYQPGASITVTGNTVLYADWVAATYDLGQFNAQVTDTVSTNSFITTRMFDYNYLFNIHSANPTVTVSSSDHSETWSMVTSGNVNHGDTTTKNFIFVDNDSEGVLAIPRNRNDSNMFPGEGIITQGIYTKELRDLLFSTDNIYDPETGTGVIGKNYLGTGDHLFQIMTDPNDEHFGYYYYDSKRNAASYNQTNQRFYVYDYLAATSDSIGGAYSDFIPLNSPYANTNGKTVGTYNYNGVDGEYQGIPHYRYDSKYNSGDYNSANNVQTDYAYGMCSEVRFYLPNDPGTGGNKDLYGNDMQFQFSGDDDVWVLVDGVLVLDIGGIHTADSGVIDFTTGEITVQGVPQKTLMDLGIGAGDHTLTILYLERGSSMSNCSIYFNLAPRFGMELRKEDVLTQKVLDGAEFTVYTDFACTKKAELWDSEEAYNLDFADGELDQSKSSFTITDGVTRFWGLGSGNTYYLKETKAPQVDGYGLAQGVIRLTIERQGMTTYQVEVIKDAQGNEPSKGFTVHGVNIDEATQTVYLTVTNAPESVTETTKVQVIKTWADTNSHSDDYIKAYLTVTDPDGTVRRIREINLSDENNWEHIWVNLPKYDYNKMTEVQYGIEESYESGYYSTVRRITQINITKTEWAEALTFQKGQTYILRSSQGYLSTLNDNADTGFKWVDEATAKSSPNALWKVTINNGKVKFTNGKNQTLSFYYGGGSPTDWFATTNGVDSNGRQEFSYGERNGAIQIFYQHDANNKYYLTGSMNSSQKFGYSKNDPNSSLLLIPSTLITKEDIRDAEDWAYQITNTPLAANNETAMSVEKHWVIPAGYDPSFYQEFEVTVRLLANGVNTGRTVTLTLKNGWKGSFQGLPYKDAEGKVIVYTVEEVWKHKDWSTTYGPKVTSSGSPPKYSTVITNTYYPGGPELPSTGSAARLTYVLCGTGIMLGSLVYGIESRRKRERRME